MPENYESPNAMDPWRYIEHFPCGCIGIRLADWHPENTRSYAVKAPVLVFQSCGEDELSLHIAEVKWDRRENGPHANRAPHRLEPETAAKIFGRVQATFYLGNRAADLRDGMMSLLRLIEPTT